MREDIKCYICQNVLTKEEIEDYFKNSEYCCDGRMCGCYGYPIDPPVCDKCSKESEEIKMSEKQIIKKFERTKTSGSKRTNSGDSDPKSSVDIEYFKDKLFGNLKVPKQFLSEVDDDTARAYKILEDAICMLDKQGKKQK